MFSAIDVLIGQHHYRWWKSLLGFISLDKIYKNHINHEKNSLSWKMVNNHTYISVVKWNNTHELLTIFINLFKFIASSSRPYVLHLKSYNSICISNHMQWLWYLLINKTITLAYLIVCNDCDFCWSVKQLHLHIHWYAIVVIDFCW